MKKNIYETIKENIKSMTEPIDDSPEKINDIIKQLHAIVKF